MDYNKYVENYSGDKSKLIYLVDKVKQAKKNYCTVFTDFLTPEEAALLKNICFKDFLKTSFFGGLEVAEREIGAIFQDDLYEDYPIEVIAVTGNFKFETLNHRDYLGALLSLGIKRDKIGDINVFEDGAEIFLHSDIAGYVALNLNKIRHCGVKTNYIRASEAREKIQEFKEMKINVSSLRMDCIVAALINTSRASVAEIIKTGDVKLNYSITYELNSKLKLKDLISIKGFGRYLVEDILGVTKSDRLTLLVKKYL